MKELQESVQIFVVTSVDFMDGGLDEKEVIGTLERKYYNFTLSKELHPDIFIRIQSNSVLRIYFEQGSTSVIEIIG